MNKEKNSIMRAEEKIGLKRGTVALLPHQMAWERNAENTIKTLKELLGEAAVDIQHVGSTAILAIHAKPIIDIAVGIREMEDIVPYIDLLAQHDIIDRGEDVSGQRLFVMGDFENDTRTHHIHVVKYKSTEWRHYINFRDYLNAYPEKAMLYDACKQNLAQQFADDRGHYTEGKQELITQLLKEADVWKRRQGSLE